MACRTCKHLNVPFNKAGRRIVRKEKYYPCTVEVIKPLLPDSITKSYDFRWPPSRSYISGDSGENCPKYETLKPLPPGRKEE